MRIAFLITDLAYGGAEMQVVQLASALKSRGWNVMVVSIMTPKAFVEELRKKDIIVRTLNINNKLSALTAFYKLRVVLQSFKPDILHCHMVHANLLGRISRYFVKVPVLLSTIHTIYDGGPIRMQFYRLTDHLADLTTIISNIAAKRYLEEGIVSNKNIRVVPNGIDISKIINNPDIRKETRDKLGINDKFVWLAVGRLEKSKDYPNLLKSVSILVNEDQGFKLLIVGDGNLKAELMELAKQLQINDFIEFLGIRKDVYHLMVSADAFVMSSAWEGLPMVLLEASASSLPIVATDVGGNSEIVLDGKSGFLVPPKNSYALADAMRNIMQLSSKDLQKMGIAGCEHVEQNYAIGKIVTTWENIYHELLKQKHY